MQTAYESFPPDAGPALARNPVCTAMYRYWAGLNAAALNAVATISQPAAMGLLSAAHSGLLFFKNAVRELMRQLISQT